MRMKEISKEPIPDPRIHSLHRCCLFIYLFNSHIVFSQGHQHHCTTQANEMCAFCQNNDINTQIFSLNCRFFHAVVRSSIEQWVDAFAVAANRLHRFSLAAQ